MKRFTLVAACLVALALSATPAYARVTTKLKASISKSTCTYNSPAAFTATLSNSSGHRLGKKAVILKRDGVRVGSYKTNSKGVVTHKVRYLGTAHWQYAFAGDSKYKASSSAVKATRAVTVFSGLRAYQWYRDEDDGSTTWDYNMEFSLKGSHNYQCILGVPSQWWVYQMQMPNSQTPYAEGTSDVTSFAFKCRSTGRQLIEWLSDSGMGAEPNMRLVVW